jgi:hypothetical protein
MPAPTNVNITPADTWVKVATAVRVGKIKKGDKSKSYVHTYVDTGAAAPTGLTTAAQWPLNCAQIQSSYLVDVYVMCIGDTGSVRVEL